MSTPELPPTSSRLPAEFPALLTATKGARPSLTYLDVDGDTGRWSQSSQCTNPAQCANCSPGNCGQCFGISDSRVALAAGETFYRERQSGPSNCAQCANCTPGNCGQCGWIDDSSHRALAEAERYYR